PPPHRSGPYQPASRLAARSPVARAESAPCRVLRPARPLPAACRSQFVRLAKDRARQTAAGAANPLVRTSSSATDCSATLAAPELFQKAARFPVSRPDLPGTHAYPRLPRDARQRRDAIDSACRGAGPRSLAPLLPPPARRLPPPSAVVAASATGSLQGPHGAPVPGCDRPRAPQTKLPGSRKPPPV